MIIFDFFVSAFLSVFFSVAPKYWKNCTDEKIKSFVNKLFLALTISQAFKLIFLCCRSCCYIFEIVRSRARTASRAEGGLPFPSVGFFTVGRHSGNWTVLNTQRRKNRHTILIYSVT